MKLSYKYNVYHLPLGCLQHLKRRMRWVRAAGGVVTDDGGDRLLILRNGRWDLPKGKVETGETLLQGALREVEEETGLKVQPALSGVFNPVKTYHVFNLYGGWHLKQTSWFAMHIDGHHPQGTPQTEEGIAQVVWVTPDEWYHRLQHSYGTLKTLSSQWTKSVR